MSHFSQNADENADAIKKVTFLAKSLLFTIESSLTLIEKISDEIQIKNIGNSNLYLIIFTCNKIAEIIDQLPNDEFKKYCETIVKKNLSEISCYIVDKSSKINCNDFYENFLKHKKVNQEILSKVQLKKGGVGGLMIGIAVTALALLQTTTPVLGALFSGDNFVRHHNALHGINSSPEFIEASRLDSYEPFTKDQQDEFARLDANIHGVCATNAFVAELCTGGCPSKEEWKKLSPQILQRIRNAYGDHLTTKITKPNMFNNPSKLSLGADTDALYGTTFAYVSDGFDMEWFRTYFSEGAKKHFSKEKSSSDMIIATVRIPNHALNMMYNMKNQKLCLHDENRKARWSQFQEKFVLPLNSNEYVCEKGFFEEYQIKELNKLGYSVFETTGNIHTEYNKQIGKSSDDSEIFAIQPQDSVFLLDKSNNTGNVDQYIEILKDVRKSIIEGEKDGLAFLENNQEKFKTSDETLAILRKTVQLYTNAYDLGFTQFNLQTSRDTLKSFENELKAEQTKTKGGTGKRKKRVCKKRKSRKKTK
jgi:hypothetical protein